MPISEKRILLVDDSEADQVLTVRAMRKCDPSIHVDCVNDGLEALKFMRGELPQIAAAAPDLILLDINMPMMSGLQVLESLRQDDCPTKVVMLTTSTQSSEIREAQRLGADAFLAKPIEFEDLIAAMRLVADHLNAGVELPEIAGFNRLPGL